LEKQYSEVLQCVHITVGVGGFWIWVATVFIYTATARSAFKALGKKKKSWSWSSFCIAIFSLLFLVLNVMTSSSCFRLKGYTVLRIPVFASILALSCGVFGEVTSTKPCRSLRMAPFISLMVALLLILATGPVFYFSVMITVSKNLILHTSTQYLYLERWQSFLLGSY
jgi:hypothetical protein